MLTNYRVEGLYPTIPSFFVSPVSFKCLMFILRMDVHLKQNILWVQPYKVFVFYNSECMAFTCVKAFGATPQSAGRTLNPGYFFLCLIPAGRADLTLQVYTRETITQTKSFLTYRNKQANKKSPPPPLHLFSSYFKIREEVRCSTKHYV